MHIEIRLARTGKYPCLELNAPLLTWNDWMQDNLSLLSAQSDGQHEIILFSFKSGAVLARCLAEQAKIEELFSSPCLAVAAISIDEKHITETTIFKDESFDTSGCFFKGIEQQTSGELPEAIASYEMALRIKPGLYRAHNLTGLCHRLSGQNELAEKSYLASIELNPDCPEALSNLATLYYKTGRENEAEKLYKKALHQDEFYLNALLKLSEIYMNNRNVLDTDYLRINLKLLQLYSSLPAVMSRLKQAAEFGKLGLEEYSQRLISCNSHFTSTSTIQMMSSTESFILNGAFFGAINSMRKLLAECQNTYHQSEIIGWCRSRLSRIQKHSEKLKHLQLYNAVSALLAERPDLKLQDKEAGHSPLTALEFFSLVILEIMRDGQIEANEKKIVTKLRNMLEISDSDYNEIINKIRRQVCANPFIEREPKGFQPERLFKSLVRAAARDKVIEESEKKILVFASKAFGISSENVNRIIAEVRQ
jgi:tetratricopeptide (TPR) repeat protein